MTSIKVNGVNQTDLDSYSLRWVVNANGTPEPVLYKGGKRVTEPWELVVNATYDGDSYGGNANTA